MKTKLAFLKFSLGGMLSDVHQVLLSKIEALIMSTLAPLIAELTAVKTEAEALKSSNSALTADATEKQIALDAAAAQIADLQTQLAASGIDPAELATITQLIADIKATLAP